MRRMQKYSAKAADGFGSKLERAVHDILVLRERSGEIRDIKRQQTVVLQEGKRPTKITWRVDFSFEDVKSSKTVYVEAKGFETRDYVLKLKLWRFKKIARLEIWGGHYRRPVLREIVECD